MSVLCVSAWLLLTEMILTPAGSSLLLHHLLLAGFGREYFRAGCAVNTPLGASVASHPSTQGFVGVGTINAPPVKLRMSTNPPL